MKSRAISIVGASIAIAFLIFFINFINDFKFKVLIYLFGFIFLGIALWASLLKIKKNKKQLADKLACRGMEDGKHDEDREDNN